MGMIAAAMMALQAAGGPAPLLAPSGKWVVEYEDNMCVLSRTYGKGDAARVIAVKPVTFGDVVDIVMVIDNNDAGYRLGKGQMILQPGGAVIDGRVRSWRA